MRFTFISMKCISSSQTGQMGLFLADLFPFFDQKSKFSATPTTFLCLDLYRSRYHWWFGFISIKCRSSSRTGQIGLFFAELFPFSTKNINFQHIQPLLCVLTFTDRDIIWDLALYPQNADQVHKQAKSQFLAPPTTFMCVNLYRSGYHFIFSLMSIKCRSTS